MGRQARGPVAAEERACAPTRPNFRTAAPGRGAPGRLAPECPHLTGERTLRAHGAHAPAHSHALHTHGVPGPTPVPRSGGLPAPHKGPTQLTSPQAPAREPWDRPVEAGSR